MRTLTDAERLDRHSRARDAGGHDFPVVDHDSVAMEDVVCAVSKVSKKESSNGVDDNVVVGEISIAVVLVCGGLPGLPVLTISRMGGNGNAGVVQRSRFARWIS